MSRTLDRREREAFLAAVHVGVISVESPTVGRAPLCVPIWYDFDPAKGVSVMTGRDSQKGRAIEKAGRFSLVAQQEAMPYQYVAVEGPLVSVAPVEDGDVERLARRYFGAGIGATYASGFDSTDGVAWYTMTPERWYTYTEAV